MKKKISQSIFPVIFLVLCAGCSGESSYDYYPKPRGFMRLDFPEKSYHTFEDSTCPYSFLVPDYFVLKEKGNCLKDIQMDRFNATLYLTYLPLDSNLLQDIEYSRKLVYEHSTKADAIEEIPVLHRNGGAYGLKYNIVGDAASPYQFYLTDSSDHFLRGALYFNAKPNYDSVKTSLDYIAEDLDTLLQTVSWKYD